MFRLNQKAGVVWSNDAEPLRVWLSSPKIGEPAQRFLECPNPADKSSSEERTLNFAVELPAMQTRTATISGCALYNIRRGEGGERQVLRQDFDVSINP